MGICHEARQAGDIRDKTVADGIEDFVLDDDRACTGGHHAKSATVDQPAGQGGHEGWDAQLGDRGGSKQSGEDAEDEHQPG